MPHRVGSVCVLAHRSPCLPGGPSAVVADGASDIDYAQLFMVCRSSRRFSRCVSSNGDPPDPRLLAIGLRIRALREERQLSLEELAHRSDLSFRGLIYIEHGRRNPGVLTLLKIADGLEVSPAALFDTSAADSAR